MKTLPFLLSLAAVTAALAGPPPHAVPASRAGAHGLKGSAEGPPPYPVMGLPALDAIAQRRWMNEHIIATNTEGLAMEPYSCLVGPARELQVPSEGEKGKELRADLGLTGMSGPGTPTGFVFRDYVVRHMLEKAQASGKPIVIFAHGGLNFLNGAIKRAIQDGPIAEKMCYPIYVCWDSSMLSSYGEHLFHVRNGTNLGQDDKWWACATWPIYLATDLMTSAVRTPRMLVDLGRSNLKGWSWPHVEKLAYPNADPAWFPDGRNDRNFGDIQDATLRYYALKTAAGARLTDGEVEEKARIGKKVGPVTPDKKDMKIDRAGGNLKKEWDEIRHAGTHWAPLPVSKGEYHPELGESTVRIAKGWALAPVKLGVLAGLAGAGGDMWDVMSRRTHVMYHYESGYRPAWGSAKPHDSYRETNPDIRDSESTGIGCLAVFFRKLEEQQAKGHCRKVTLVGHSMGAIIFNDALREFPAIRYDAIVYLAAACSIRDFYNTAIPYLERRDHTSTQFYSLSLHPRAEDRDIMFGEFVPRGSLLIWIDEILGHPQSFTDRTLGHFDNAMLASRLYPPRLQKRLHFTALATGPARNEMSSHGDFSSANFWSPDFYKMDAQTNRKGNPALNLGHSYYDAWKADNTRRYAPRVH